MQVHYSLDSLPEIPSPVVTVGSFDGVHKGHRTIIQRLNALAAGVGGASVLITFSPHPRKVLYPQTAGKNLKLINSLPEKCLLLKEAGLDHLVIMEFTREFALTSSTEFVKYYLLGKLHAHTIVVGFNHFFGHNKEGNYHSLYRDQESLGYRVEEIPEQEIQNETVSSTKIRKALSEGNIQRVNAYLEHLYMVQTRLEKAKAPNGSSYRFRSEDELKLLPPEGAYAVSIDSTFALTEIGSASVHHSESAVKGLVRITDAGSYLHPLSSSSFLEEELISIRFRKQLESGTHTPTEDLLAAVRELIY